MLLWLGELVAFTLSPFGGILYRVEAFVWAELDPSHHHVLVSLDEGILALTATQHKPNAIEGEVANRPLLLDITSAKRVLRIRPPSLAR